MLHLTGKNDLQLTALSTRKPQTRPFCAEKAPQTHSFNAANTPERHCKKRPFCVAKASTNTPRTRKTPHLTSKNDLQLTALSTRKPQTRPFCAEKAPQTHPFNAANTLERNCKSVRFASQKCPQTHPFNAAKVHEKRLFNKQK